MEPHQRLVIYCLLIIFAGTAFGDQTQTPMQSRGPADTIVGSVADKDLQALLQEVLERNPEIEGLSARISAAGHRSTAVRKLPDPRAELTAFVLPPETRVGPQRFSARLSQQLPGGGKREISGRVVDLERHALTAEIQALRLTLVTETRRLVVEIAYLDQARQVLSDDHATLVHFEELARTRYASGTGLQMDAIQLQTELTRLDARTAELDERRAGLVAEINRLRDRPGASVASVKAPRLPSLNLDWNELRERALASRPELRADDARIGRSATLTELATKDRSPDFSVGLTYAYVDKRTDADVPKNGQDVLGISGGVTIPLWKSGNTAVVEAATGLRLAHEAERRATVAEIHRTIETLEGRIPEIERRLRLLEEVLPIQAEQALDSAVAAYAAGRVEALALLEAERVLLDVRLSAARGRADLAVAFIELEGAVGAPLTMGDRS